MMLSVMIPGEAIHRRNERQYASLMELLADDSDISSHRYQILSVDEREAIERLIAEVSR